MVELAVLCDRMDNDGSGALSLQELLDGFDNDLGFQDVMKRMDIETGMQKNPLGPTGAPER